MRDYDLGSASSPENDLFIALKGSPDEGQLDSFEFASRRSVSSGPCINLFGSSDLTIWSGISGNRICGQQLHFSAIYYLATGPRLRVTLMVPHCLYVQVFMTVWTTR